MNDFDDRLRSVLRDDTAATSVAAPDLDEARSVWRRRRSRRLAGVGAAMSVVVVGAGIGIVALGQGDADERIVTDTVSTPITVDAPPSTILATVPITSSPDTAVPDTSDVTTPATENLPTETAVDTSSSSVPTIEAGGLEVVSAYVDATTVVDADNVVEIRSATDEVLWSYRYCDSGAPCRAEVQTVLADGVWVVVQEGVDENGRPSSSVLRRVGLDGGSVEDRFQAGDGSHLAAAQPSVIGDLVAVSTQNAEGADGIDVGVTAASGDEQVLATGVQAVEVSADGRYVATTSYSLPEDYGQVALSVLDLLTGERKDIVMQGIVTAAPTEFSADGSRLVVRNNFELFSEFVIEPWSAAAEIDVNNGVVAATEVCLVDGATAAVATWDGGYAESGVENGTVTFVDLATRTPGDDLVLDTFGRRLVCAPDGTVTFIRVPTVENTYGTADDPFTIVEQDFGAPVDVVRVAPGGTPAVIASGEADIRTIR